MLNVGTSPNDGTGMPLRDAMIEIENRLSTLESGGGGGGSTFLSSMVTYSQSGENDLILSGSVGNIPLGSTSTSRLDVGQYYIQFDSGMLLDHTKLFITAPHLVSESMGLRINTVVAGNVIYIDTYSYGVLSDGMLNDYKIKLDYFG